MNCYDCGYFVSCWVAVAFGVVGTYLVPCCLGGHKCLGVLVSYEHSCPSLIGSGSRRFFFHVRLFGVIGGID